MGWLSTLGKIGGLVAAPFTGGASLIPTIASIAGDVGSVIGQQQQGAAQGRQAQEVANQGRDRTAVDLFGRQQDAQFKAGQQDLDRKQFENTNRGSTAKQALIGALLSGNIDPTSISGGKASGGLLAALKNNPEALASMKTLNSQAGSAQASPLSFTGGSLLDAPKMSTPQQIDKGGFMSTLASVLSGVGAVGSGLSGLSSGSAPSAPYMPTLQGLGGMPGQAMPIPKKHIVDDLYGDGSNR